jgi:hypothetical protein
MRDVIHNLAIGLITFHVVGGCCLHHAHAWTDLHAVDVHVSHDGHLVPHEHPCSDCPRPPAHPADPCQEGTCQFIAPQKTRPCELPVSLPGVHLPASLSRDATPLCLSWLDVSVADHARTWYGLRLHLVEQVLLL